MVFINDAEWLLYKETINAFHEDAFQQEIVWHRSLLRISKNGFDNKSTTLEPIIIKGLIQYNDFRSWPINKETKGGEIDSESMLVFLNLAYLGTLGYLNSFGQFDYKPDLDRFEVNGVTYVDKGNSQTAQAKGDALLHFLVLKREELNTPNNIY